MEPKKFDHKKDNIMYVGRIQSYLNTWGFKFLINLASTQTQIVGYNLIERDLKYKWKTEIEDQIYYMANF